MFYPLIDILIGRVWRAKTKPRCVIYIYISPVFADNLLPKNFPIIEEMHMKVIALNHPQSIVCLYLMVVVYHFGNSP